MNTENPDQTQTPRKHLVESAAYWFRNALAEVQTKAGAVHSMENAYNHVENALAAMIAERDTARAEATEAKKQLEHVANLHELRGKALLMGSDEVKALRAEVDRLTVRCREYERWPSSQKIKTLEAELTTLRKESTPSPTLEKLAHEIDDLYEAPSRIRLLRRILEREFGVSRSVAETAKEIIEGSFGETHPYMEARRVESILSRFCEHELLALKAVLEQRKAEANLAVSVSENLQTQLESSQTELRELREECERLRKDKERLDWLESDEGFTILPTCGVPEGRRKEPTPLRVAIDAAMQPSAQSAEETKP